MSHQLICLLSLIVVSYSYDGLATFVVVFVEAGAQLNQIIEMSLHFALLRKTPFAFFRWNWGASSHVATTRSSHTRVRPAQPISAVARIDAAVIHGRKITRIGKI